MSEDARIHDSSPAARQLAERVFAIYERQIEHLAACLRTLDRARSQLLTSCPAPSEDFSDELTRCIHSLYELTNRVRAQPAE